MPLARYFLYVGGALLALLLISDAYLPKLPVADNTESDPPVVRIHSDRKWPERVVYDTGAVTIVPVQVARPEAKIPVTVADVSAGVRAREAFAQLQQPSAVKQLQHKHGNAKRRAAVVIRQPRFGFGNDTWWTTE